MKTRLTDLLNIQKPIIQGGMAWISESTLAAAVSEAGGLGVIAAANAPTDWVRDEIRKVKALTDKPFGLNVMLMSPYVEDVAQLVCEERVPVVLTGAGNPAKYIPAWKEGGTTVLSVLASAALAVRLERAGVDGIVAEGCESGGHIGEVTTMCLVPQIVDAVKVPVVAAGGIADGRGMAAAFMLGAVGVQAGTVFLVAEECQVHENYKNMVLKAGDRSTEVTGSSTHPVRCLKNKLTKMGSDMEKRGVSLEEMEQFFAGSLRSAAVEGNMEKGSFMSGQIAGLIKRKMPAREIMETMMAQAQELLQGGG